MWSCWMVWPDKRFTMEWQSNHTWCKRWSGADKEPDWCSKPKHILGINHQNNHQNNHQKLGFKHDIIWHYHKPFQHPSVLVSFFSTDHYKEGMRNAINFMGDGTSGRGDSPPTSFEHGQFWKGIFLVGAPTNPSICILVHSLAPVSLREAYWYYLLLGESQNSTYCLYGPSVCWAEYSAKGNSKCLSPKARCVALNRGPYWWVFASHQKWRNDVLYIYCTWLYNYIYIHIYIYS